MVDLGRGVTLGAMSQNFSEPSATIANKITKKDLIITCLKFSIKHVAMEFHIFLSNLPDNWQMFDPLNSQMVSFSSRLLRFQLLWRQLAGFN